MDDLLQAGRASPSRCIATVSHSSYLKTLLATLQNVSLINVASLEIKNASVSVIDIQSDGSRVRVGPKSRIIGGPLSMAEKNFRLDYPTSNVLRINEKRHLGRLAI